MQTALRTSGEGMENPRIVINIRGIVFETFLETLEKFPDTLLGTKLSRQSFHHPLRDELVFDRNPVAFDAILFYYQSNGCLIRPPWVRMKDFEEECRYFCLGDAAINKMKKRENYIVKKRTKIIRKNSFREKIRIFFEYPESSRSAKLYGIGSFLLIVISVALTCAISLPRTGNDSRNGMFRDALFLTELVLQSIFGVEFLLKLSLSPEKIKFMKNTLNAIDAIAVLPYFIILVADVEKVPIAAFLKIVRTARVLRLLRLIKYSENLEISITIITRCFYGMAIFLQCLLLFCFLFGSLEYLTEHETPNTQFVSIPEAMWWALQTVVCLGYGDIVPKSIQGKIMGSVVATVGTVLVSVPLFSIGRHYKFLNRKTFAIKT